MESCVGCTFPKFENKNVVEKEGVIFEVDCILVPKAKFTQICSSCFSNVSFFYIYRIVGKNSKLGFQNFLVACLHLSNKE